MHELLRPVELESYYQRQLRRAKGGLKVKHALSQTLHSQSLREISFLNRRNIERFTEKHTFRLLGRDEFIWWLHRTRDGMLWGSSDDDRRILRVMAVVRNTLIRLGRLPEGSYRL